MKLRIARKILKRHSNEVSGDLPRTVPPRLIVRATKREHQWRRRHLVNRDVWSNPSPKDLHLSRYRTRRCQPKAELRKLWMDRG